MKFLQKIWNYLKKNVQQALGYYLKSFKSNGYFGLRLYLATVYLYTSISISVYIYISTSIYLSISIYYYL